MNAKIRKLIYNPWLVLIAGVPLTPLIAKAFDQVFGFHTFSYLHNLFIGNKFEVNLLLIILVALGPLLLFIAIAFLASKIQDSRLSTAPLPRWLSYTEDEIKGVKYKWEWGLERNGRYGIFSLSKCCNNCGCRSSTSTCPDCGGQIYNIEPSDYDVKNIIIRNAERMDILE